MRVLYILQSLNRIAPNTVIMNSLLSLVDKLDGVFVVSLYKSASDNYKATLTNHGIRYKEYNSQLEAFKDLTFLSDLVTEYDILHLNQYKSNEIGNILHKYNTKIKVVSTCHSVEDEEAEALDFSGNAKIASVVRQREQSNFYRKHNTVFAVSHSVKGYLKRIECQNVKVVHSGLRFDTFPSLSRSSMPDEIHFCQVGHIMPLKNQMYSARLIAFLKTKGLIVHLHVFGKDEFAPQYKQELLQFVKDNGLSEQVSIYGEVSWDILFTKLLKMDILLMPSLSEGLPLALLEAMYCSVTPIVSKNGGMTEVVANKINGLVLENVATDCDFEQVLRFCSEKRYRECGSIAKRTILNQHDSKTMADLYFTSYEAILNEPQKIV